MRQIESYCGIFLLLAVPLAAQADLTYEKIGGNSLIYDSVTGLYWTQNANLSGTTYNYNGAANWVAGLKLPGLVGTDWQLPNGPQFTSMYDQLVSPIPGSPDHRYGPKVDFAASTGPNDYAANVQTYYWTDDNIVNFNFYYGYTGGASPTDANAVWAVTTTPVLSPAPEPNAGVMSLFAAGLVGGLVMWRRKPVIA